MQEQPVLVETQGRVGLVTLNRPQQMNALDDALMNALGAALLAFDADTSIGAIVIAGIPTRAHFMSSFTSTCHEHEFQRYTMSSLVFNICQTVCSIIDGANPALRLPPAFLSTSLDRLT